MILILMLTEENPEISLSIISAMSFLILKERLKVFTRSTIQSIAEQMVLHKTFETNPNQNTLLTVVSHSLGTVVLSGYLYEKRNNLEMRYQFIFSIFFKLGSLITLYTNQFYNHQTKNFSNFKPQKVTDTKGVWVNVR